MCPARFSRKITLEGAMRPSSSTERNTVGRLNSSLSTRSFPRKVRAFIASSSSWPNWVWRSGRQKAGQLDRALEHSREAATYPDCLGLSIPFIRYDAAALVAQAAILLRRGEQAAGKSLLERAAGERHRETNEAEYFSGLAYRYLGQADQAQAKFEHLIKKSNLDGAWPDRDPDYGHFLAALGKAGLGSQGPLPESLSPGLRKRVAIYARLHELLLPGQG